VDGARFYHANLDCIDLAGASGIEHASFETAIGGGFVSTDEDEGDG